MPAKKEFQYDAFQQQAIDIINQNISLLVSAPTGAGKTLIAEYAIEKALEENRRAVYTAPIKALSNQKYRDFSALYGDKIGILTGDVTINPQAPILIMTTEIYRNTLFEDPRRVEDISWVIFDEVHYLDDIERGTVWEEAMMFSPLQIKFLCLSATVPNVRELADWMETVHHRPMHIIVENHRPVPLTYSYQCQGTFYGDTQLLRKEGYMNRDHWESTRTERRRKITWRAKPNRLFPLISHIKKNDRLPAIYFAFGRRRTETLAWELSDFDFLSIPEKREVKELTASLFDRFNLNSEPSAADMLGLLNRGIAFHHAGMLPTLKEVVERLFTSKLIKLIFTTETFALGINMPARSVVFDELRKFYGTHFGVLRTRDFYQMAGRAGRRGMDREGFVYMRINPHDISFPEVIKIVNSENEAIYSQFNATYATLLNLFKKYGLKLLDIYPQSLHFYQSSKRAREKGLDLLTSKLALLQEMNYLENEQLTPKGEFASWLYGYELFLGELHQSGIFDQLNEIDLVLVLCALIYEPRKGEPPVRIKHLPKHLVESCFEVYQNINHFEEKYAIRPKTKFCYFHLSDALREWCRGRSFEAILKLCHADEGQVVRYFRMVIQLLRQLAAAPQTSPALRQKAHKAIGLINRDVIDAEKQLRL